MYAGFTMGGLATSVDGEVLNAEGRPVPGLYAAGACAANIAQDGKGYASGTQLGRARSSAGAPGRTRLLARAGFLDRAEVPAALAEQFEHVAMVLADGVSMAHADQNGIGQFGAQQPVQGQLQPLVQR